MRRLWRKIRRLLFHSILHADDSPHRIAMGVAAGLFVTFTPTPGLQTVLAIALAAALRGNKLAAVPWVWLTNPITMLPIYGPCYKLGAWIVGSSSQEAHSVFQRVQELALDPLRGDWTRLVQLDFWRELLFTLAQFGAELWVGCLIVSTIVAVIGYFVSRQWITNHRARRAARIQERHLRRERRRFAARPAEHASA